MTLACITLILGRKSMVQLVGLQLLYPAIIHNTFPTCGGLSSSSSTNKGMNVIADRIIR